MQLCAGSAPEAGLQTTFYCVDVLASWCMWSLDKFRLATKGNEAFMLMLFLSIPNGHFPYNFSSSCLVLTKD